MRLSDVLHQDAALDRLQRAITAGRMPHAYLFSGPEGIGKEMTGVRLASLLLCSSPSQTPPPKSVTTNVRHWNEACGTCVDCDLMRAGNHPDYHRIYRTLNKVHPDRDVQKRKATELGIDVIRHFFIEKAGLRPSRDRAKVFVIAEGDKLNASSQNAMLKTLEEPPEKSYIILLSASGDLLLDTTRSRCHQVSFRYLPTEFVANLLIQRHSADTVQARFLSELSQGSAGKAIQFFELGVYDLLEPTLQGVARASDDPLSLASVLLDNAKKLAAKIKSRGKDEPDDEDGADLNTSRLGQFIVLAVVGTILRDVQRTLAGVSPASLDNSPAIKQLARNATSTSLRTAVRAVNTAEYQIGRNAQVQLVFDVVSIAIGQALSSRAVSV